MKNYKEILSQISAFIFDVDGVLTNGDVALFPPDNMVRTMNTRDGFAIQYAIKKGYTVCVITGGNSPMVKYRLEYLGVKHIFMQAGNKSKCYDEFLRETGIRSENVAYMGDDLPDYHVMNKVALAACPADAAVEIREISHYISPLPGGAGCVRDLLEQTLRVQDKWFDKNELEW
jgi:3-deoxy-D-manno-octulosonate 8-phosphate phosphatase (KDO 8-P phosphatase)